MFSKGHNSLKYVTDLVLITPYDDALNVYQSMSSTDMERTCR